MSVLDKFLDAIRLNDDYDEDDEFFDDDDIDEMDEAPKPCLLYTSSSLMT